AVALLDRPRGPGYASLPGTRREVTAIARLFPRSDVLLGSEANEQRLAELAGKGGLRNYGFLHFATHGVIDDRSALSSALILSQDHMPEPRQQVLAGQKPSEGRVTAADVLHNWQLDANLVTLSACETALGSFQGGEGYVGFTQALFAAGARSVVLSLWQVDD